MTDPISLYYGDNGAQEFWEPENGEVLIFKNHHEAYWIMHIDGQRIVSYLKIEDAVNNASHIYGAPVILDHSRKWEHDNKALTMQLVKSSIEPQEKEMINYQDLKYEIKISKRQGNWRPKCQIIFYPVPIESLNIYPDINLVLLEERECGCQSFNQRWVMDFPLHLWSKEDRFQSIRPYVCCSKNKALLLSFELNKSFSQIVYLDWRPGPHPGYSDYLELFHQACNMIVDESNKRLQEALASPEIPEVIYTQDNPFQKILKPQKIRAINKLKR